MRALAALLVLAAVTAGCGGSRAADRPRQNSRPHTLGGLEPPRLQVTHPAQGVAPGLLFVAEKAGKKRPGGPVITDDQGRIRWYHQLTPPLEATDFRTQRYRGRPVLTWWEGTISKAGVGIGRYVVYDSSYQPIATLRAAHGLQGDLHDFELTPRGTAYITVYKEVPADLSPVGGPRHGWAYDSVVQELDVATGRVVWEWHSLDHVPLSESVQAHREPAEHATKKRPLDYFHVNSVADAPGGRIVISARNTSAIYLLDRSGRIVWRLGGKRSDFGPPAAVKFAFQHDARLHSPTLLTLFDNGAIPKVEPYTRPLVLRIDQARHRAAIVKSFVHPQKLLSPFEGNLQLLPDGGALVGWGGVRRVTEFTPDGRVRFELKLPFGDTYRAFRAPWHGAPRGMPRVAVDGDTVYASWNGSTAVARWDVLSGDEADDLHRIGGAPWGGLETAIDVDSPGRFVAVRALDAAGRTLATSPAVAS